MWKPTRVWMVAASCLAAGCAGKGATPRPFPGAPTVAASPAPAPATTPAATAAAPAPATASTAAVEASPESPESPARAEAGANPLFAPPAVTALLSTALTLQGVPYRNGGTDPSGFDCSGFVRFVFGRHGTALPREVRDQFRVGTAIDRSDVQPGDLVFFETVSRGASHVGIAIGGMQFVHAPSSRGVVRVERFTADYWARRWVGARRVA
jgi:cell wall-associated NlpC family hydrolase